VVPTAAREAIQAGTTVIINSANDPISAA